MGAFEDAIARIRGPRIEDLFSDDASYGAPSRTTQPVPPSLTAGPAGGAFVGETPEDLPPSWEEQATKYVRANPGTALRIAAPFAAAALTAGTGGIAPFVAGGMAALGAEPLATVADILAARTEPERKEREDAIQDLPERTIAAGLTGAIPGLGPGKTVARTVARTFAESIGQSLAYEQTVKALEGKGFLTGDEMKRSASGGIAFGGALGLPLNLLSRRHMLRQGYELRNKAARAWFGERADDVGSVLGAAEGGGTYNPLYGGLMGSDHDLYSVALPGHSLDVAPGQDVAAAVRQFADDKRPFLETGLFGVGKWTRSDGTTVIDVQTSVPGRSRSAWLGRRWDQEAIWHFAGEEEIPTGGAGARGRAPISPDQALYDINSHPVAQVLDVADRARERLAALGKTKVGKVARQLFDEELAQAGVDPAQRRRARSVADINAGISGPVRKGSVQYNDVVSIGSGHVLSHEDFPAWSARMSEEFPNLQADQHSAIYEESRSKFAKFMARSMLKVPEVKTLIDDLNQKGMNAAGGSWLRTREELTKLGFPADTIDHLMAFLQVTSANKSLPANVTTALRVFSRWYGDLPARDVSNVGLTPSVRKMVETVVNEGPTDVGDLKIRDFLNYEKDPDVVVVDRRVWKDMLRMPGDGPQTPHEYRVASSIVRDLARKAGETPREYFSHAWVGVGVESGRQSRGYGDVVRQRLLARDDVSESILRILEPHAKLSADEIRTRIRESLTPAESLEAARWTEGIATRGIPPGAARTAAVTEARALRARHAEAGEVKLDALFAVPRLAVWGAHQLLRGTVAVGRLGARMVGEFGSSVRRYVGPAVERALTLLRGSRRAYETARAENPRDVAAPISRPTPTGEEFAPNPERVGVERQRLERKYGVAGRLLGDLLADNEDLIQHQSRGVVSDEQLERLAEQVKVNLDQIARGHLPKAGTAATAEEIKAVRDLVSTLDSRVDAALRVKADLEPRGEWSVAHEADLTSLTNAFVNTHAALAGFSAEAGRALRAHQVAKGLRNRDVEAFLEHARQRGLSSDDVAGIMATHHDPLSRAAAVQALTKTTARKLYNHARYWTMLIDPATWVQATVGNAIDTTVRELGKIQSAAFDRVLHRGGRYVFARDLAVLRPGAMLTGVRKGMRRALHIFTHGVDPSTVAAGKAPAEELFAGRALPISLTANLPFRALSAGDALSTSIVLNAEMHEFALARARRRAVDRGLTGKAAGDDAVRQAGEWLANPPEWLFLHADRLAKQVSLQSPLGRAARLVDAGLRAYPEVSSFVLPFLRTRVNLVKQFAKKTPAGFVQAHRLERAARTYETALALAKRRGIRVADVKSVEESGGPGAFQDSLRREAAVVRGEAIVGTEVMLALPLLLAAGFGDITGDPPNDQAERARLERERPFSAVRVGNAWVDVRSFGSLEPYLRAVGNAKQAFDVIRRRKVEGVDETWEREKEAFAKAFVGLTKAGPLGALDSLNQALDAGDPDRMVSYLGRTFKDLTIVGTAADKVQKYRDPYVRRIEGPLDPLRGAFAPATLAPRLDPLGDPVLRRPFPIVKQLGSRPDDLLNEAAQAGVAISAPNEKTLRLEDGTERKLSVPERRVLNFALGRANRAALRRVVGDRNAWAMLDADERKRELTYWRDTLRGDVRAEAIAAVGEGRPITAQDLLRPLQE